MKFDKIITKDLLRKFCDDYKIFYPPRPKTVYLMAAIYRFVKNGKKSTSQSCFGFWDDESNECSMCSYENKCFKLSVGEEKEKYNKQVSKSLNVDEWI